MPDLAAPQTVSVPHGCVAEVATHLEMLSRPLRSSSPPRPKLAVVPISPDLAGYRRRFRAVGAPWLWGSRLRLGDAALAAIIDDPDVEIFELLAGDRFAGLLELDFRKPVECELAFFGVTTEAIGTGAGRFLMDHAIAQAWTRQPAIRRFWVHTCTNDHPAALGFYMRSGFVPFRRSVEIYPDPRLAGVLARTDAPQIPIIE